MAESKVKRILNKKIDRRYVVWFIWLILLVGFDVDIIVLTPKPLPHPEYIPTILSGLVTSMSVLMAFAFFFMSHLHASVQDKNEKRRSTALAMIYMFFLFFIMIIGIIIGYGYVLINNDLLTAFICFLSTFILMCALVLDMWSVSSRYLLK